MIPTKPHTFTKKLLCAALLLAGSFTSATAIAYSEVNGQSQLTANDIARQIGNTLSSDSVSTTLGNKIGTAIADQLSQKDPTSKTLKNLYLANVRYNNALLYQADKFVTNYAAGNTLLKTTNTDANTASYNTTMRMVNALMRAPLVTSGKISTNDVLSAPNLSTALANQTSTDQFMNLNLGNDSLLKTSLGSLNLNANPYGNQNLVSTKMGNSAGPTLTHYNDFVSFGNLIGPTSYNGTTAQQGATLFMLYAGKLYKDIFSISTGSGKSQNPIYTLMTTPPASPPAGYTAFINDYRSYVAKASVGLGNLAYLVTERSPVTTTKGAKNMSQLELEHQIATFRSSNPDWYRAMSTATPATIQRETLFVLADIQAALYQAHLDRERMLATMSMIELTSTAADQADVKTDLSHLIPTK